MGSSPGWAPSDLTMGAGIPIHAQGHNGRLRATEVKLAPEVWAKDRRRAALQIQIEILRTIPGA